MSLSIIMLNLLFGIGMDSGRVRSFENQKVMKYRFLSVFALAVMFFYCCSCEKMPEPLIDYVDEYGVNHGTGVKIGKAVWAPVNCGYHKDDFKYGKLYQWGRKYGQGYNGNFYDGDWDQEYSDASFPETIKGPVTSREAQSKDNENKFYYNSSYPWHWCGIKENNLWNSGTEKNPVKAEYDPCPDGWRVPTYVELKELNKMYVVWIVDENIRSGCWFSEKSSYAETVPHVFLPAAGYCSGHHGSHGSRGRDGYYWSSKSDDDGLNYIVLSNPIGVYDLNTANGHSVRCVQE